jgi:hypothetical protein
MTKSQNVVLAVARVDFADDKDGASFMTASEKSAARALAKQGYLRILRDTRKEVVAVLTDEGAALPR